MEPPSINDKIDTEINYEIKDGFVLIPEEEYRISKLIEAAQAEVDEFEKKIAAKEWGDKKDLPKELYCRIFTKEEPPLKLIRKHRGLSQDDLAAQVGVSKTMISHMENGHKQGSARTLINIARVLGVGIDDLV